MARRGRRKQKGAVSPVWIIVAVVLAAVLVGGGIFFGPKLIHHCDNCDRLFFGTGYYSNILSETVGSLLNKKEKILCRDCAQEEHALEITFGASLDEYKRPLFEAGDETEKGGQNG